MVEKNFSNSDRVILPSGFVATQAEIEWAKGALAERPEDFDCIEDVLAFKKSYEEAKCGEGKIYWYI